MSSTRKFIIRRQKQSAAQERKVAIKLVGGRRVAGSGSQPGMKGDVKSDQWLVECKQSKSPGFRLTLQLWRKIEWEAIQAHKNPVMVIELAGRSLAVLDYNDFLALSNAIA